MLWKPISMRLPEHRNKMAAKPVYFYTKKMLIFALMFWRILAMKCLFLR
jgi:hypothetical protein